MRFEWYSFASLPAQQIPSILIPPGPVRHVPVDGGDGDEGVEEGGWVDPMLIRAAASPAAATACDRMMVGGGRSRSDGGKPLGWPTKDGSSE